MQLLIIDDHALFREGLMALVARADPSVETCGVASLAEARQMAADRTQGFDLVLLDLNLGDTDSHQVARHAIELFPGVPVVVLSGACDPCLVRSSIEAGAMGFIPKALSFSEFSAALERSLAGEVYLPQVSVHDGLRRFRRGADDTAGGTGAIAARLARLSPRQMEILRLLVYGLNNRAIAEYLGISEGTVKTHMGRILPALGAHSRAEAVYLLAQVEHSIGRRDPGSAPG